MVTVVTYCALCPLSAAHRIHAVDSAVGAASPKGNTINENKGFIGLALTALPALSQAAMPVAQLNQHAERIFKATARRWAW